jgi:hypothetical protein
VPPGDTDLVKVARSLRAAGVHVIGLIPAGDRWRDRSAGVHAVALPLAAALSELSGQRIVCVRWSGPAPEPAPANGAQWHLQAVSERVVLLMPVKPERNWSVADLEAVTEASRRAFEHVIIDLTGFERTGELGRAVAAVDATAIVAGVGITREAEILDARRALEGHAVLGVVLVDPRTMRKQP